MIDGDELGMLVLTCGQFGLYYADPTDLAELAGGFLWSTFNHRGPQSPPVLL